MSYPPHFSSFTSRRPLVRCADNTSQSESLEDEVGREGLTSQILYDLPQLPRDQLPPLRDSILTSLASLAGTSAPTGSRAILIQLCLALADLALQMPEWSDIVGGMIERFGKDPATVNILLGFLKALVEEVGNPRLVVSVSCGELLEEPR